MTSSVRSSRATVLTDIEKTISWRTFILKWLNKLLASVELNDISEVTSISDSISSNLTSSVDLSASSSEVEISSAELKLNSQLELDTEIEWLTESTEKLSFKSSESLSCSSESLSYFSESLSHSSSISQDAELTSILSDLISQLSSQYLLLISSSSASSREELYLQQITFSAKKWRVRIQKDLRNNTLRHKELEDQSVSSTSILNNHIINFIMSLNTVRASISSGNEFITEEFSQVQMNFLFNLLKNKLCNLDSWADSLRSPDIQESQEDSEIVRVSDKKLDYELCVCKGLHF